MKKITTEEEREQLRSEADFLEGFFSVRYAMSRESNILEVLLVVLSFLSPIMICSFFVVALYMGLGYGWLWLCFLILALFWWLMYRITDKVVTAHYEKNKALLLAAENIYINWVTVVNVDKGNRLISYMEDGALSPDNRKYIVDCIATPGDCKRVVKGERILIAYISNEEGKRFPLLMVPKPGFRLMSETRQGGPVSIAKAEHIPHVNAFAMRRDKDYGEGGAEEEEVLFCATSKSSVIKPSGSGKSRCSTEICYYEWNGRSFERNWCIQRQNLKCEYGDILIKKYDRLWRRYFQVKDGENN